MLYREGLDDAAETSGDAHLVRSGASAAQLPQLSAPVKVLVAETRVMVAEAMGQAIVCAEGLALGACCGDAAEVSLACAAGEPDVAVLDVGVYGGNLDVAVQALRDVAPSAKVLLSVPRLDLELFARALLAGADNCISGRVDHREFIEAVRATASGESLVPAELENGVPRMLLRLRTTRLSRRELEVLQLVAMGLSVAQIAAKLFVSVNTAQTHLRRTYRKLGVHNRSAAITEAIRIGILPGRENGPVVISFGDNKDH